MSELPAEVAAAIDLLARYGADLAMSEPHPYEGSRAHVEAWIASAIEVQVTEPDYEQLESEFFEVDGVSGNVAYARAVATEVGPKQGPETA